MRYPTRLTLGGRRAALDYGIKTIIDLRKPEEVAEYPNPLRSVPGVRYINISMVDPAVPRRTSRPLFTITRKPWTYSLPRSGGSSKK